MPENQKNYDVVIVGGGLGGLLCGAILAKNGHRVCILEKHHRVGGNLQSFKRKGVLFNSAMHYVGAMEPGQILHQVFSYLGIEDRTGLVKMNSGAYEKIYLGDQVFSYAGGLEAHRERLLEYFPEEARAIDTYLSTLKEIWDSTPVLKLRDFRNSLEAETRYTRMEAHAWIEGLTDNRELKDLWGVNSALYGGIPGRSPLNTHAIIAYHYILGAYKFDGGSDKLAAALAGLIEQTGGSILCGQDVVKLQVENRVAKAAQLKDGSSIAGSSFISSIHPTITNSLVEPGVFRKAYVKRIAELENTTGIFSLYASLKRGEFENIDSNVTLADNGHVWPAGNTDNEQWPEGCILYTTPDKDHPGFARSLVLSAFMDFKKLKSWNHTKIEQRGEDYRTFKKQKADALLDYAQKRIPGIREAVEDIHTATPLTFRDYTGTPDGSAYGILKDCNNMRASYVSTNTRVENLFITGQNSGVGLHGVLGVCVSALFTCAHFLDIEEIMRKMRHG